MIKHNIVNTLFEKLNGALAENTLRGYRTDYKDFAKWCFLHDAEPLNHEPETMTDYVLWLSESKSVATIDRRLASLSSILKYLVLPDTTKSADVVLTLKKIKRQKGTAQKQAEPLTKELINKLLPHCGKGIVGMRNKVMLYLGNETMRRRSELCKFTFDDIRVLPGNRYGIRLRFSKTDQMGKGKTIPITEHLYNLLMQWKTKVGDGFILRGVNKAKRVTKSLAPSSVNRILQDIQYRARVKTEYPLSGHSFRVGGALDLLMQGTPMEKIMLRGGWTSESTVIRYLRAWDLMDY